MKLAFIEILESIITFPRKVSSSNLSGFNYTTIYLEWGILGMTDRISDLPDSLLCYILSFLPTKVVVATSVLSSRWKSLWTMVPNLDFDDEMHEIHTRLDECVCRVLILRNNEDSIKKLRIKCKSNNCSPYHVNTWISAAIKYKVEHLEFCMLSSCIELPRALFNCATLVILKLIELSVESYLSSVQLPSLKQLHFEAVEFSSNGVVRNVLSGCPRLEKLVLKCLAYFWEEEYCDLDVSFPNLIKAELDFMTDDLHPSYVLWVFNILKSVCNVKFLTISEGASQFDFHSFAIMKDLPIFHYLTHLKLGSARMWLDMLPTFLQKFCRLEVLAVDKFNWDHPNWWWKEELKFVPNCVSSHLTSVDIRGYEGSKSDLKFSRYLLKNAKVLKTMNIRTNIDDSDPEENLLILEKLSAIPRASPMCKLLFNEIYFS